MQHSRSRLFFHLKVDDKHRLLALPAVDNPHLHQHSLYRVYLLVMQSRAKYDRDVNHLDIIFQVRNSRSSQTIRLDQIMLVASYIESWHRLYQIHETHQNKSACIF